MAGSWTGARFNWEAALSTLGFLKGHVGEQAVPEHEHTVAETCGGKKTKTAQIDVDFDKVVLTKMFFNF